MTITEARIGITQKLIKIYDESEANNIAELVLEHITQLSKKEQFINKSLLLNSVQQESMVTFSDRLLMHEPVQYILGEAWFSNMKFNVDKNVLIPRPETEELVEWIVKENKKLQSPSIIDIGTGSGCVPISLKKKLPESKISAIDICNAALSVAKKNAMELQADIHFLLFDFLKEENRKQLNQFDIIVSNPPYIPISDKTTMNKNVLLFEPQKALFVSNEDPFIFYKAIAEFGKNHLTEQGKIYVEISETFADDIASIFKENGYKNIVVKKDMQGKNRMIRVSKLIAE